MIALAVLEKIIDASGVAPQIEAMLPIGVGHRQLRVRTLLAGMMLSQADHRPAHLTRVRDALIALPGSDQVRLGVLEDWETGPHLLTYRQTERTFGLVASALDKDHPDGLPPDRLQRLCDGLLEASIPGQFKDASGSLAVDWTDLESFSRPPPARGGPCADPEASWGHRKNNLLRSQDELFFGYYLSAAIMMPDEHGPAVPEFARRATASSCQHNPVRAFAPVLTSMPGQESCSATCSPTPATPTATQTPGPSRSARQGRSSSRTCTRTTAARKAPTTAPSSATAACTARKPATTAGTGTAGPRRDPRASRRARRSDRRAGPLQARPDHPRRR